MATPDAETPPGPALPVPAPDALPLPNGATKEKEYNVIDIRCITQNKLNI